MRVTVWVAGLLMALDLICVLRAAFIVAVKADGRFMFDPLVSLIAGFQLIY